MADIYELLNRYFLGVDDVDLPTQPEPRTFDGSRVTPLIDGNEYFAQLRTCLEATGNGATSAENAGDFVYIAGWYLDLVGDHGFTLDGVNGTYRLIDVLKMKAQMGVDVRVLGFISAIVAESPLLSRDHTIPENVATALSVDALREEPTLANNACLNTVSHPAGCVHLKMIVTGTPNRAVGFTGGMDLTNARYSDELHPANNNWHDVQAMVEGPAAQGIYDCFRDLWHEALAVVQAGTSTTGYANVAFRVGNKMIRSVPTGASDVPSRTLSTQTVGFHHVQSLRTVPEYSFAWWYSALRLPMGKPVSFAPEGLFEVRAAWRKAILGAQQCIYIEDQFFWSVEIMQWINEAVRQRPQLKVVMVTPLTFDPNYPDMPPSLYIPMALLEGLLPGLTPQQIEDQLLMLGRETVYVHAKTTLIDDHWAIIGSANVARRSLYTDFEHAVAIVDEEDLLVRNYRIELWGGQFALPKADRTRIGALEDALNVWNTAWGTQGFSASSGIVLPSYFRVVNIQPAPLVLDAKGTARWNLVDDPDSRDPWSPWSLL